MNVTCFFFSFSCAYQKSDNILFLLGSVSLEPTRETSLCLQPHGTLGDMKTLCLHGRWEARAGSLVSGNFDFR